MRANETQLITGDRQVCVAVMLCARLASTLVDHVHHGSISVMPTRPASPPYIGLDRWLGPYHDDWSNARYHLAFSHEAHSSALS